MAGRRALTLQDVARLPAPGMNAPVAVRFSPDGSTLTYLFSSAGSLSRELWAYDLQGGREWRLLDPAGERDGDAELGREEELRRERQRQYATGVTGYAWSREGTTLLAVAGGELRVRRGVDAAWQAVGGGQGCLDPQLNGDGSRLAFVRDGELYVQDLAQPGAEPRRLTFDASPVGEHGDRAVTNGLAEFIAQEEMGRASGFWWSPDGERLAFEQVDHSAVPLYLITHPGTEGVETEAHRYPFAGGTNARVRLGVVPVAGGAVTWLPLGDDPDIYLARVHWTPDGRLLVQVEARDQRRLEVRRLDADGGASTTLWTETGEPWLNLTDDLRVVHREGAPPAEYHILWSAERSGRRELYLYDRNGTPVRQLTRGDVMIDGVADVDADGGSVYFHGWSDTPLERHLFRVPLAGGTAERLTAAAGMHHCVLAPGHDCYADSFDAADSPPSVTVRGLDGTVRARLQAGAAPDPRLAELELAPPEFVEVKSRDGVTLHGALYRPSGAGEGRRAPVVVSVYGGPHVQRVTNSWAGTAELRAQYLAQQGFVVFKLDNRGSARRGLSFEAPIHRNAGDIEVQDQVDGVRYVTALPFADPARVGVYGWSYGGYMALMCLARAPEVFKAAVAGAPVTDWRGYDTHYSERYMGHPDANPEGYRRSSVLSHVANMRGALLLVHGMIDENVHFRHSGRLIQALITAGIEHELLLFPEERHGPRREEDRVFLERRVVGFLNRHLG